LVLGPRLLRADDAPLHCAEVVLSALPHGVSGGYVHAARAAGKRAVDLSADFRLSPEAVYGLTEVTRPRVAAAELVANPGCYPTAALLALLPLARRGLIDASREVVIDAASGVTGAGRAPRPPAARYRPSRTSCTAIAWRSASRPWRTYAGRGSR